MTPAPSGQGGGILRKVLIVTVHAVAGLVVAFIPAVACVPAVVGGHALAFILAVTIVEA